MWDLEQDDPDGEKMRGALAHYFAGYCAAVIDDMPHAYELMNTMIKDAAATLRRANSMLVEPTNRL